MISIRVTMTCDHCGRPYRGRAEYFRDVLRKSNIESIRSDAHRRGWARYRVHATAPQGDYCPACRRAHDRAREGASR